jgi:3-oxoacyl-[acyl-carrier-protein] synthase-3
MKCILNNVVIKGISTYLPTEILEMRSLIDLYGEKTVESIMKATGVERVRVAGKNETASDMCFAAAENLIKNEGIERSEIDGLVFISQTPDYRLPATSIVLQDRLGLSKDTVCFDISYGCSAYIYGIYQASLLVSSGSCKNVLMLAGDTTTKMINQNDKAQRMVFGDCGSATLVTKGAGDIGFHIRSDGSGHDRVIIPAGGYRTPSSEETRKEYEDKDGNVRSQEDLYNDGLAVFNFIIQNGRASIDTILEYMKWTKEDVKLYAFHQATTFTVNFLVKRLKIDKEKAPINIVNYGNTGPATIPLILSDMYHINSGVNTKAWDKTIMCAYGVGLSWGSIACDLSQTNIYEPINK